MKQFYKDYKHKTKLLSLKRNTIFFFTIILCMQIIFNVIAIKMVDSYKPSSQIITSVFTIIISVTMGIFIIITVVKSVRTEISDKIIAVEMRYSRTSGNIFLVRMFSIITVSMTTILILLAINLIFYFSSSYMNSSILYRMFLVSIGWYVMVIAISMGFAVFFSVMFKEQIATALSTIFFAILLVFSAFGTMLTSGQKYSNNRTYIIQVYNDVKNADFEEIAYSESKEFANWNDFENRINVDSGVDLSSTDQILMSTNYWVNDDQFNVDFSYIVGMYEYFTNLFSANDFGIDFSDISGLNDTRKIEPTDKLLRRMDSKIEPKYRNIFNIVQKYYSDALLLNDYQLIPDWIDFMPGYIERAAKKTDTTADQLLFLRLLTYSLKDAFSNFDAANSKDIVVIENHYRDLAHDAMLNLMVNPISQMGALFNGVNYSNEFAYNLIYGSKQMFGGVQEFTTNMYPVSNVNNFKLKEKRIAFAEVTYIEYLVICSLVIFGSYFKFKKNIKK